MAHARLAELGCGNVTLRVGDGARGWRDTAPFDKILGTAAAREPPARLLDQLIPGGRLVMPLGDEAAQKICLLEKRTDESVTMLATIPAKFTLLETA